MNKQSQQDFYEKQAELVRNRIPFALCTILDRKGSSPAKPGAKMLVRGDGKTFGTVGGAELEYDITRAAMAMIAKKSAPVTKTFSLFYRKEEGLDLACGGSVQVFIEVILPSPYVLICGGGHVGLALSQILDVVGYAYAICDARPPYRSPDRFPGANTLLEAVPPAPIPQDAVVLMTHSQQADYDTLKNLHHANYPGPILLIGSKAKWIDFSRRLTNDGVPELFLQQIRCPAGLPIKAATPGEIALSFAAWLVDFFRAGESSS